MDADEALHQRVVELLALLLGRRQAISLRLEQLGGLRTKIVAQPVLVVPITLGRLLGEAGRHLLGNVLLGVGRLCIGGQLGKRHAVGDDVGLPLLLRRIELGHDRVEFFLRLGEGSVELHQPLLFLRRADDHPILRMADDWLLDVGEEGAERVEIAGLERVELVVVALRAAGCLAEPGGTDRANAVGEHPRLVVLGLGAPLLGREQEPVEPRANAGLLIRIGHEVPGHLMDRELVKGLVVVEAPDHPVAVGPDISRGVAVVADRVGEPDSVEPADRHLLAIVRAGKQAVYQKHVCIRTCVGDERRNLVGSGRQAEQVK